MSASLGFPSRSFRDDAMSSPGSITQPPPSVITDIHENGLVALPIIIDANFHVQDHNWCGFPTDGVRDFSFNNRLHFRHLVLALTGDLWL